MLSNLRTLLVGYHITKVPFAISSAMKEAKEEFKKNKDKKDEFTEDVLISEEEADQ